MVDAPYLTLKYLLAIRLQSAIDFCNPLPGRGFSHVCNGIAEDFKISSINSDLIKGERVSALRSLFCDRKGPDLSYRSAIALKLAARWRQPVEAIANQLIATFKQSSSKHADNRTETQNDRAIQALTELGMADNLPEHFPHYALDFELQLLPSGSIQFQLCDRGIAVWLDYWLQILPQHLPSSSPLASRDSFGNWDGSPSPGGFHSSSRTGLMSCDSIPDRTSLFLTQYSHARCCALLRLASRGRILVFSHSEPGQNRQVSWYGDGSLVAAVSFPWLDTSQRLRLIQPAERRLIAQLFRTLDELALNRSETSSQLAADLKLATALSQSFQKFYSQCRILGEVKQNNPQLAQARIGLVAMTQILLREILAARLGTLAPFEL